MKKIGINGMGRIGRALLRQISITKGVEVVHINDLAPIDNICYLMKFDTLFNQSGIDLTKEDNSLIYKNKKITLTSFKSPSEIPWDESSVDIVVDCSGQFLTSELLSQHIKSDEKVILSAPAKDNTKTIVMGVNCFEIEASDNILSNASCTTNCLAPLAHTIDREFEILEGLMTTIHAVTSSQAVVDRSSPKDFRLGRNAYQNIIPSTTGAAKALEKCIPNLKGKLTGMAFRVPVSNVSVVDLTVKLKKKTSLEEINKALKKAESSHLKGILQVSNMPLVSSDCLMNTHSSIFDPLASMQLNDNFFKLISWYDNEWGYTNRIIDMIQKLEV